ncbi:MAG: anthranilate synthase component I family protein, partial [Natronospirillum sp.]
MSFQGNNNNTCTDPLRWLSGLQGRAYPVLFDSGLPASPSGRYAIVAAEPRTVWRAQHPEQLEVWQRQHNGHYVHTETLPGPVLDRLALLQSSCPTPSSDNGSFNGGLIGLLPYALSGHTLQKPGRRPFPTNDLLAWIGDYDRAVIIDHHTHQVHTVGDVSAWAPADTSPSPAASAEGDPRVLNTSLPKVDYLTLLGRIKGHLFAGDIYQVNLTRQFFAPWQDDALSTYCQLRRTTPMPFSGYLDLGNAQLLSLSPERFLKVDHGHLETKPIKGTRPRGQTTEEDEALLQALQESEKDRAENLMIVDLLRNDLGKTAVTGSVQVPHIFAIESYANVHQLVSTVTAELHADHSPLHALMSAFPGGSITGAPKKRAMEIIAELEPHRRGPYCGSLFYADVTGRLDSNILIRSVWLEGG